MSTIANARRLRREQTGEEKELWRVLRAGRFAGFKFRRQHPVGIYFLDVYCPAAKLSVEFDGFQHGMPERQRHDEERTNFLMAAGIEELRFWNHQWQKNREGVLLEIWTALHRRTGCVAVMRKAQNHRFLPPKVDQLIQAPSSPRPSPPSDGGEGVDPKRDPSPCPLPALRGEGGPESFREKGACVRVSLRQSPETVTINI